MTWWEENLVDEGKVVEAQRLHQRTMYDLEMIKEMGFCRGIENYSRHLTGKTPGEPPPTLLDYLPRDALMVIDESHQTIPQIRGDVSRATSRGKERWSNTVFACRARKDNRPLNFEEFEERVGQTIYVSATPGPYELTKTERRSDRADHSSDRVARSGRRGAAGQRADRRSAGRMPRSGPSETSACWSRR